MVTLDDFSAIFDKYSLSSEELGLCLIFRKEYLTIDNLQSHYSELDSTALLPEGADIELHIKYLSLLFSEDREEYIQFHKTIARFHLHPAEHIAAVFSYREILLEIFLPFWSEKDKDAFMRLLRKKFILDISIFSSVLYSLQQKYIIEASRIDTLTSLPNKRGLLLKMEELLEAKKSFNVAIFDIKKFGYLKEQLGFTNGDYLLKLMKERILNDLKNGEFLSRSGFDEFTIIFPKNFTELELTERIEEISSLFKEPIVFSQDEVKIKFNVGVSKYPEDGISAENLLDNALVALYVAKRQKKTPLFYTKMVHQQMNQTLTLKNGLKKAIKRGEFVLFYQPKIDIKTFKVTGAEALIRWNHPEKGILLPGEFIPMLEETELIIPVGEWVLREASKQIKSWIDNGMDIKVAVNISPLQLQQNDFVQTVLDIVYSSKIPPKYLELEITENFLVEKLDENFKKLMELKRHGIDISIDDFGTGYSSLAYLKQLPINTLKIDLMFIKNLPENYEDKKITEAIVSLAKLLNLKTISEGVESWDQLDYLREIQCTEGQGFYFSKPINGDDFTHFYKTLECVKTESPINKKIIE
ncbi:bifunctional diguanylate cyclase/phosphodiesterase [bacterium]|nr:bifunctional diguanylate cyclase/phosphodiesterase [bacterium]